MTGWSKCGRGWSIHRIYFCCCERPARFDNAGSIITERDAYGDGQHRWHPALAALAEEYGFRPRVCRPCWAKTKGKVERFNGYLRGSFITPLAATLKSAGLILDVPTANAHIGRWLGEVAHQRVHGTTGVPPAVRLAEERGVLLALPAPIASAVPVAALRPGRTLPHESLQHPLSVYDQPAHEPAARPHHISELCSSGRPAARRALPTFSRRC